MGHPSPASESNDVSTTSSVDKSPVVTIEESPDEFKLKRNLGFVSGVSIIVGTIVGSGIFISPKGVLQDTGSVAASLLVWIGAGMIALMGGLCYAELGTLIQTSGGEYTYMRVALGNVLAFLYTWVSVLVIRSSSNAVKTLTMAEYMATFFSPCGDHTTVKKLIAATACVTVGLINGFSTKLAARVQVVTTALKVLALGIIVVGGIVRLFQGHTKELSNGFEGSTTNLSVIAMAFYKALWAYAGWQNLNAVTEELKKPSKNLPRAIIVAVLLVTLLYTLTNVSYLTAMSVTELLGADAVAVLWGDRVIKAAAIIIPISVIISTFGSTNGTAFIGSRFVFVAARDHNLPDLLSYIHVKMLTPLTSLIFNIGISLVLIAAGDIFTLINFLSFLTWLFFGFNFVSLLILRYTMRDVPRPYRVPIIIPIVMVCIACYLVIAPIVQSPRMEFLYAFLFLLAGLVFYIPFVVFGLKLPGWDKVTMWTQMLLDVSPTDYKED